MTKQLTILLSLFLFAGLEAQERLEYFLPDQISYDQAIPAPDDFLMQKLGERHLTHGQVLDYFQEIARVSPRAILQEYARSYENKPLVQLVFTSEENHKNLDHLRELHVQHSDPGANTPSESVPLVVRLAYGVHGNESSATNSSVLTAYYLAAAQGKGIDSLLNDCIILVDPCLNPDGYSRHTTWANANQSRVPNGDPNSRQFREPWPRGRSNHYWFDLNRDYLPIVNPESKGRVKEFHRWMPNIVTDHHESSANFTFFFQPGIPSRNNPLIPEGNYTLTSAIARYHAKYLDQIGSDYFSEEIFDDYYFGKGSTYPDVNGSIGILFEQSSIRGRVRETTNGTKSLAFGIRNQFTVSLSTLQAALDLGPELLAYQKEFYKDAWNEAQQSEIKAYMFGNESDRVLTMEFIDFLKHHNIQVYGTQEAFQYLVPVEQKQYRIIRTIFEEVTSFRDTSFYDISTWTIPHAFHIPITKLTSLKGVQLTNQPVDNETITGMVIGGKGIAGYCFRWNAYTTPEALYELQNAGLRTKVASGGFSIEIDGALEKFSCGTILVPLASQQLDKDKIHGLVERVAQTSGVDFYALPTGLTGDGIDMGSSSLNALEKPEILMFIDGSTSSTVAGGIWHMLDQRFRVPLTLCGTERLSSINLDAYTTVILPGGTYREWEEKEVDILKRWTEKGGVLISLDRAAGWLAENKLISTTFKDPIPTDSTRYLAYAERRKESYIQGIGGVILNANLDLSHPLCYGYTEKDLAIFKRGTRVANPLGEKYLEPVRFAAEPYLSGWISEKNLERIREAPVLSIQRLGNGKVISFYETINFRGFWMGTHKLFMNAVFFGDMIQFGRAVR